MRIDFEDLEVYLQLDHKTFANLIKGNYTQQQEYWDLIGGDERWNIISSPYYIYDVLKMRDTGVYEIWYDYIKRNIRHKATIYDFGAGVGSLETMLIKRYPESITVSEPNLICRDFISWRLHRRGYKDTIFFPLSYYDYVISIDMLQRLPEDQMKPTLRRLLTSGARCFIYVNTDDRHPFFNKVPFDVEEYVSKYAKNVNNFHGLLDVNVNEN